MMTKINSFSLKVEHYLGPALKCTHIVWRCERLQHALSGLALKCTHSLKVWAAAACSRAYVICTGCSFAWDVFAHFISTHGSAQYNYYPFCETAPASSGAPSSTYPGKSFMNLSMMTPVYYLRTCLLNISFWMSKVTSVYLYPQGLWQDVQWRCLMSLFCLCRAAD